MVLHACRVLQRVNGVESNFNLIGRVFSEKKFVEEFRKSPIRRIGWISFLRNVIIVAGNSKDKTLISKIKRHLNNENPIIRGSSVWSLGKLMSNQEKRKLKIKQLLDNEKSDYVLFEWENFTLK